MSNTIMSDYPIFYTRNKDGYYFAGYQNSKVPNKIVAWRLISPDDITTQRTECLGVSVLDVSEETLKTLDIWDKLTHDIQTQVQEYHEVETEVHVSRMEEARKHKRKKYPDLPRELTCITCKKTTAIPPSVLGARLEKNGRSVEVYLKDYKCQVCNPTKGKGRKAGVNAKPNVVLKCHTAGCTNGQTYPYSVVDKTATKKGLTVDKFVDGWFCQSCKPTKGRVKGIKLGKVGKIKSKA